MVKKHLNSDGYNSDDFYFSDSQDELGNFCLESQSQSEVAVGRAIFDQELHEFYPSVEESLDIHSCPNQPFETTRSPSEHESRNQSFASEKSSRRKFLKFSRRPKGYKNSIEKNINGYWSKNVLQFGKTYHFEYIKKKLGFSFIKQNKILLEIFQKKGMTMQDYEFVYRLEELKQVWEQFFGSKVLYRALMLSRTQPNNRLAYLHFMPVFQKAFREKRLQSLRGML